MKIWKCFLTWNQRVNPTRNAHFEAFLKVKTCLYYCSGNKALHYALEHAQMGELYFLLLFFFFVLRERSIFCGSLGRFQVLCKDFQVLSKGFRNWPAAGATQASSGNFAQNLKTLPRTWKVLREPQKIECSRSPKKKNNSKKYMFSHFTLISATLREGF